MAATIVADHLESLLLEIDYASRGIASHAGRADALPDEVERSLIQALETARRVLESALDRAHEIGVPKLALDAA